MGWERFTKGASPLSRLRESLASRVQVGVKKSKLKRRVICNISAVISMPGRWLHYFMLPVTFWRDVQNTHYMLKMHIGSPSANGRRLFGGFGHWKSVMALKNL